MTQGGSNARSRSLAAGTQRSRPADRGCDRIAPRTDRRRDAQRHLRTRRKPPAAWKFLSRLLPEHLRQSGVGTQAREGPYRFAPGLAPCGLAMERAGLREQFGRAAHECLLLPAEGSESRFVLHAGRAFGADTAVWIPAGNSSSQR